MVPDFFIISLCSRAFSSVVERFVHIEEVAGPIPATPTFKIKNFSAYFHSTFSSSEKMREGGKYTYKKLSTVFLKSQKLIC